MKQSYSKLLLRMLCALALGVTLGLAWPSQGGTTPSLPKPLRLVNW
jgi:hypothetical protein